MSEPVEAKLLRRLERYLKRSGMSASAFSRTAVGDHQAIGRLRRGISTLRTVNKIQDYLDKAEGR